jgi:hypothetical protein
MRKHRFGVRQKEKLKKERLKKNSSHHGAKYLSKYLKKFKICYKTVKDSTSKV